MQRGRQCGKVSYASSTEASRGTRGMRRQADRHRALCIKAHARPAPREAGWSASRRVSPARACVRAPAREHRRRLLVCWPTVAMLCSLRPIRCKAGVPQWQPPGRWRSTRLARLTVYGSNPAGTERPREGGGCQANPLPKAMEASGAAVDAVGGLRPRRCRRRWLSTKRR